MELAPAGGARNAEQNRLLALNYVHAGEDPLVCSAHAAWGAQFAAQFEPLPPPEQLAPLQLGSSGSSSSSGDEGPGSSSSRQGDGGSEGGLIRPLVVGYVSPDLFTHSVSYFAEAPIAHHDPRRWAQDAQNKCLFTVFVAAHWSYVGPGAAQQAAPTEPAEVLNHRPSQACAILFNMHSPPTAAGPVKLFARWVCSIEV